MDPERVTVPTPDMVSVDAPPTPFVRLAAIVPLLVKE